jgi:hypothetical protein
MNRGLEFGAMTCIAAATKDSDRSADASPATDPYGGTCPQVQVRMSAHERVHPEPRHWPADLMKRMEQGEAVDPSGYYLRIVAMFETAVAKYDWLNGIVAIGIGHRRPEGPVYSVFEVL